MFLLLLLLLEKILVVFFPPLKIAPKWLYYCLKKEKKLNLGKLSQMKINVFFL